MIYAPPLSSSSQMISKHFEMKIWSLFLTPSRYLALFLPYISLWTRCYSLLGRRVKVQESRAIEMESRFLTPPPPPIVVDHRVHIFTRDETGLVYHSAQSAGAYTATLLVMVNVVKGGGQAPPTLTSLG
jgi:hypothetical protein